MVSVSTSGRGQIGSPISDSPLSGYISAIPPKATRPKSARLAELQAVRAIMSTSMTATKTCKALPSQLRSSGSGSVNNLTPVNIQLYSQNPVCPYDVLNLKRREARESDFQEVLEQAREDAFEDKENGEKRVQNFSEQNFEWAYQMLRSDSTRLQHESSSRNNKCTCRSAWERLLDPEQAFLYKHRDYDHNVPELSNPHYDHSEDYQIEDTHPITWSDPAKLYQHHCFVEAYDTLWQEYDNTRESEHEDF